MHWACNSKKMTPLPGEGLTGQISFNFNYKVNFKVFIQKKKKKKNLEEQSDQDLHCLFSYMRAAVVIGCFH